MNLTRENAKLWVKDQEPIFLEVAKKNVNGKRSFVCPVCENGSGKSGDGIAWDPSAKGHGNYYKCFSCGFHADIIDLWKKHTKITDDKEAFDQLYQYYGVEIEGNPSPLQAQNLKGQLKNILKEGFYRGIDSQTLERLGVWYCPNWQHPEHQNTPYTQRIILPQGEGSYLARSINAADKLQKIQVGDTNFFNIDALKSETVFITEGPFDALSIESVGGSALALCSTSRVRALLDLLTAKKPKKTKFVLALDADEAGRAATETLKEGLKALKLPFIEMVLPEGEDPNSFLQKDKPAFIKAVKNCIYSDFFKHSGSFLFPKYKKSLNEPKKRIKTGFDELDGVLNGGLTEGLYIIGAISSLGKTAFCLQIADQIAKTGQDVLIFSLEMAASELIARSLSRFSYIDILVNRLDANRARTADAMSTFSNSLSFDDTEEYDIFNRAFTEYEKHQDHLFYFEGIGDMGTDFIKQTIQKYISYRGKTPIILIDYIQQLASPDLRLSDKQKTDKNVLELKRLSRDFRLSIIGISSVNRANYNTPACFEMFKESGSLEFSADVMIGLQLKGAGQKDFDVNKEKKKQPREIEAVILKNRNGVTGDKLLFNYYPQFNYFWKHENEEKKREKKKVAF